MASPLKSVDIASKIDQTLLGWDIHPAAVEQTCQTAVQYQFHSVFVPCYYVSQCVEQLSDAEVKVGTVTGFPYGFDYTATKVQQLRSAIEAGVDEVDMVMNISAFKAGDFDYVVNDLQSVTTVCHQKERVLKVIIETNLLSDKEIKKACALCARAEPDFVKTCTGYSGGGATVEDVKLMRDHLPSSIKVKAAGGIRTQQQAIQFLEAGAERIGTSTGQQIVES
jgi:deoxyribose-phosphate aldolase